MSFHAKDFAGSHCGCRYQQDYRPTLGRDGKKESGTLEDESRLPAFPYGEGRMDQHGKTHVPGDSPEWEGNAGSKTAERGTRNAAGRTGCPDAFSSMREAGGTL